MKFADPKKEGKIQYYNFVQLISEFDKPKKKKNSKKK